MMHKILLGITSFLLFPISLFAQNWNRPCGQGDYELFITIYESDDLSDIDVKVYKALTTPPQLVSNRNLITDLEEGTSQPILAPFQGGKGCHWKATTDDGGDEKNRVDLEEDILYRVEIHDDGVLVADFLWRHCANGSTIIKDFYCGAGLSSGGTGANDTFIGYDVDTNDYTVNLFPYDFEEWALIEGDHSTPDELFYPYDIEHFCTRINEGTNPDCIGSTSEMDIFLSDQVSPRSFEHTDEDLIVSAAYVWEVYGDGSSGNVTVKMQSGTELKVDGKATTKNLTIEPSGTLYDGITVGSIGELTLGDNTVIKFPDDKDFLAYGKLIIAGSSGKEVELKRSGSNNWGNMGVYTDDSSIDYAKIDYGEAVIVYGDDFELTNSTISYGDGYQLYAYNSTGVKVENSVIRDGSSSGVVVVGGDAKLEGNLVEDNDWYGLGAEDSSVTFSLDGASGLNGVIDAGKSILYAGEASINAGDGGVEIGDNSFDGEGAGYYLVESRNGSDIEAQDNWWGGPHPSVSRFFADGTSTENHSNPLETDPLSKGGASCTLEATPDEILNGDTSPGAAGRFIRYVSKLRNCWGRRESKKLLRTIVNDQGHPQREQALSHYLSDLSKLDEELSAIIKGEEYLADESLSTRTRAKVARLLLHLYTTSVKSPTGATQAANFLVSNGHRDVENGLLDKIMTRFADEVGGVLAYGKQGTEIAAPDTELKIDVNAYPNPFVASSTIEFTLEEPREMSVIVYDVLGREVQRLVDTRLYEGHYRFKFTPSEQMAQGVYFYRLQSGPKAKIGRLLLIR